MTTLKKSVQGSAGNIFTELIMTDTFITKNRNRNNIMEYR